MFLDINQVFPAAEQCFPEAERIQAHESIQYDGGIVITLNC